MTEGYGFYNLMTFIKIESMKALSRTLFLLYQISTPDCLALIKFSNIITAACVPSLYSLYSC